MIRTGELVAVRAVKLIAKKALVVVVIAIGCIGSLMLMASAANAQETRTAASMAAFKEKTAKLGAPTTQGEENVGSRSVPVLYFGSTKMNNDFTLVDEVAKEGGPGMMVTLFVTAGHQLEQHAPLKEYVRIATTVLLPDGTRAIGTVMGSPALESIKVGAAYRGEVDVRGTLYITDYEPIKDASGQTIGAYFVGYKK
jgi:Cache 3/Cache 2 fusion domain